MRVVLSEAHLDMPCSLERGTSMSTLIANEEWWLEADWNGRNIGDVVLYRASRAQLADYRERVKAGDPEDSYTKGTYFGAVPAHRVKCYRLKNGEPPHVQSEQIASPRETRGKAAAA